MNQRLRALVVERPAAPGADPRVAFACECGCLAPVRLTIEEYDALEGRPVFLNARHEVRGSRDC